MSHKYNKKIETLKEKKKEVFDRYWKNVSKKMARKYFWECKVLKKDCFKMEFSRSIGEYDKRTLKYCNPDIIKDDELMIEHYASINGLEICDEKLMSTKSIYWFKKADIL